MTVVQKKELPDINPADTDAIDLLLAKNHINDNEHEQALVIVNGVLNRDPDNAEALYLCGWCLLKGLKYGMAYALLRRCHELKPRVEALNQIALCLIGMQKIDQAQSTLLKAIAKSPKYWVALNNLAICAVYNCDPKEAIRYADQSLALNSPDNWMVLETKAYAHLLLGEFDKAWEGYESMIGHTKQRPNKPPHEGIPYWKGGSGLDLYLRGEQGLGDEISFASMLHEVAKEQAHVTLDCHPKLEGLMRRSFPEIEVHGTRQYGSVKPSREWLDGRDFDAWALMGSAAQYLRKDKASFPGTPYLIPDPERRTQWRALFDTLPGKKVGIAWTGGYPGTFRARRSLTLDNLLPILKTEGISWVSLQYENPYEDIERFNAKHGLQIRHWKRSAESDDYDETAAMVAELDLVISVCTSVIHLCGAIGKTCWVLCPSKPRWFYLLEGRRVPWYNSVEIFRQVGDKWPFDEVCGRLEEFVEPKLKVAYG